MPTTTSLSYEPAVSIRAAREQDVPSIERLAALDSRPAPRGDVLVGEVDGETVAALSLDDGHAVADPFRRTAGIVSLLRTRAGHRTRRTSGRPLLAPRWAA